MPLTIRFSSLVIHSKGCQKYRQNVVGHLLARLVCTQRNATDSEYENLITIFAQLYPTYATQQHKPSRWTTTTYNWSESEVNAGHEWRCRTSSHTTIKRVQFFAFCWHPGICHFAYAYTHGYTHMYIHQYSCVFICHSLLSDLFWIFNKENLSGFLAMGMAEWLHCNGCIRLHCMGVGNREAFSN